MAEEKRPTAAPETPAADDEAAVATAARPLPLAVVIGLYVAAALGAAAFVERVLVPWADAKSAPSAAVAAASAPAPRASDHGGHGGGHKEAAGGSGNVFEIDDLVVNPAESGGLRYVAASVGLRSARPAFVEEMATHEAPIKDALIRILGSKTVEQLADIKAREAMREEILSEVDRLIPEQQIDAVYFTRFVLQ